MSKIYKDLASAETPYSAIVVTDDNKYYYVDARFTLDHGFELMVFAAGKVIVESEETFSVDWLDLYSELYAEPEDMGEGFEKIVNNLENYI